MALVADPVLSVVGSVLQLVATATDLVIKKDLSVEDDVRMMALSATEGAITPASSAVGVYVCLSIVYIIKKRGSVAGIIVTLTVAAIIAPRITHAAANESQLSPFMYFIPYIVSE